MNALVGRLPAQDVWVRVGLDRSRRPGKVDPLPRSTHLPRRDRLPARDVRGLDREGRQALDRVIHLPDRVARVSGEEPVAGPCAHCLQAGGVEDQVRLAVRRDLRRGEHDLPVAVEGRRAESVVSRDRAVLAELDVHRDRLRVTGADVLDHLRVQRARVGPLDVRQVAERGRVDEDECDVLRLALAAANRKAHVDALALEAFEEAEVERVRDQRKPRGGDRHPQEQLRPQPAPPLVHRPRIRRFLANVPHVAYP